MKARILPPKELQEQINARVLGQQNNLLEAAWMPPSTEKGFAYLDIVINEYKQHLTLMNTDEQYALDNITKFPDSYKDIFNPTDEQTRLHELQKL